MSLIQKHGYLLKMDALEMVDFLKLHLNLWTLDELNQVTHNTFIKMKEENDEIFKKHPVSDIEFYNMRKELTYATLTLSAAHNKVKEKIEEKKHKKIKSNGAYLDKEKLDRMKTKYVDNFNLDAHQFNKALNAEKRRLLSDIHKLTAELRRRGLKL